MEFTLLDAVGFAAAGASLVAFTSQAMIPLRALMVVSNAFFIAWGVMGTLYPPLVLHSILLPVNTRRLWQAWRSGREEQVNGTARAEWVLSLPKRRTTYRAGSYLWRFQEPMDRLWFVNSGKLHLVERDEVLDASGTLQAESGILRSAPKPTSTARCITDVDVYEIAFDDVVACWLRNPQSGIHFTQGRAGITGSGKLDLMVAPPHRPRLLFRNSDRALFGNGKGRLKLGRDHAPESYGIRRNGSDRGQPLRLRREWLISNGARPLALSKRPAVKNLVPVTS